VIADEQSEGALVGSRARRVIRHVDTLRVAGEHEWRYEPGKLVAPAREAVAGARERMIVPQLVDLAGEAFITAHCFRYAGLALVDSVRRLRIDFDPARTVRGTDVRGSLYLDTASFQIARSTMRLEYPSPDGPGEVLEVSVDTWFRELLPSLAVIDRICARTTARNLASGRATSSRAALEIQRIVGFDFDRESPGPVPLFHDGPAPRCGAP
jgi:hypothetical protein